jgi:hypothetical protein
LVENRRCVLVTQQPTPERMTGPNTAGEEREVRLADDDDEKGCDCRFAVVDRAGVIARGKGVVSAARLALGQYEVIFNRSVRNCVYVATVGDVDDVGVEQPGEITTVGRFANVRGVFVTTHNSTGAFEDRSFHLFVGCP